MRQLDSITDSMDLDREIWHAAVHRIAESDTT